MNYTYIIRCADNSLYTGWTNDLERRVKEHNRKKGAKYTKPRLPVELVYYEEFETKAEAMRREAAIKRLTKEKKERLATCFNKNSRKGIYDEENMVENIDSNHGADNALSISGCGGRKE